MSQLPKLITIGGSAGSLHALFRILGGLRDGFAIPILLVVHRVTHAESTLQDLLAMKTHYKVLEIEEKEQIKDGHLYICPPDYHVLVEDDYSFSLDFSEKVNYSRPSLDVVFKSASEIYNDRLTAVLLSGANADGVEGLKYIKERGGTIMVQDPLDAQVAYMPEQALKQLIPDLVGNCELISEAIGNRQ